MKRETSGSVMTNHQVYVVPEKSVLLTSREQKTLIGLFGGEINCGMRIKTFLIVSSDQGFEKVIETNSQQTRNGLYNQSY